MMAMTRVFTATWPAYTPAAELAASSSETGQGGGQPGPYCQVEIWRAPQASTFADPFGSDIATTVAGGDLIFFEHRLLLRSYNSVSLSDDGTYRLTLADCHGFASVSSSSREPNTLPTPSRLGDHPETMVDGGAAQTIRLFFLPLPHSIVFSVKSSQDARGHPVVGNFHLLPVAHVPPQLRYSPLPATAPTSDTATGDCGQSPESPYAPSEVGSFRMARAAASSDQACGNECSRDGLGGDPPLRPSFSGCFVSGSVVGVLLGILLASLIVAKALGKEARERLWNWFGEARGERAGWRQDVAGAERMRTEGAGYNTSGRQAAVQVDRMHVIGDGEPSENGSSDSDAILDRNVSEPVRLPRSDEDWRALFDTLYEG
eukprot:g8988.t1